MPELLNGAIHAVVFDLGGVLCGFDPARRLVAISDATGLAPEEIQARIWDSGFDGECDAGRHSLDQILQEIPRRLGVQLSPEEVTALYFTAFPEDKPVLALVDRPRLTDSATSRSLTARSTASSSVLRTVSFASAFAVICCS